LPDIYNAQKYIIVGRKIMALPALKTDKGKFLLTAQKPKFLFGFLYLKPKIYIISSIKYPLQSLISFDHLFRNTLKNTFEPEIVLSWPFGLLLIS